MTKLLQNLLAKYKYIARNEIHCSWHAGKCTLNKIIAIDKIIANTGTCKAIDKLIVSDKIIAKTRSYAQNY